MADQKKPKKRSNGNRSTDKGRSKKRSDVKGAINLVAGLAMINRSRFGMDKIKPESIETPEDDDQNQ